MLKNVLHTLAIGFSVCVAGACGAPEGVTLSESDDGQVEYIVFDNPIEVTSPSDGSIYIAMPASVYNGAAIDFSRRPRSGDPRRSDRKFSHIRFAVARSFSNCAAFREAAVDFHERVTRQSPRIFQRQHARSGALWASFSSVSEGLGNTNAEPDLGFYASPLYNHDQTMAQVERCTQEFGRSLTNALQSRPVVVFWIYIEDDPQSEYLNDAYLIQVTYGGSREYSFLGEWARMFGDEVAQDAVLSIFGG